MARTFPVEGSMAMAMPPLAPHFSTASTQLCLDHMLDMFVQGQDDIPVMILFFKGDLAHGNLPA